MARTPVCDKSSGQRKGTWTPEEDRKLVAYVTRYGTWNWRQLPKFAGLARCGKSCRLRWLNYLRPNLKRGNFTEEEDKTIVGLHATLGNRWSAIAAQLPGRTDNEIKNHWHTRLKNSARLPKSKQTPRIHIKTTQEKHEVNCQGSATVFESSPISPQSSSSTIQDSNRSAATFTNQGSSLFEDDDFSLFDLDPLDHAASDSNSFCLEQLSVDDIPFVDFSGSEAQVSPQGSSSDQNLFRAVENDPETSKHSESEQVLVNNAPAGNLLELQEAVFQDDIWTEDLALALAAGNFFTRPSDLPGADLHLDFCDPQPSAFLGQPMFSPYHSLFA